MNNFEKVKKVAEALGWHFRQDGNDYTFSKYSPYGQDFNIELYAEDISELPEKLDHHIKYFDVSSETYAWLDDNGHGVNGAPYDMKDLYEDMEACLNMSEELYNKLSEIEFDEA